MDLIFHRTGNKPLSFYFLSLGLMVSLLLSSCSLSINTTNLTTTQIMLPVSGAQIAFSDIWYDELLNKILVPSGKSGVIYLVDPDTHGVKTIPVGNAQGAANGDVVSAASGKIGAAVFLFALSQSDSEVRVLDPNTGNILDRERVNGRPEIIRFIPPDELWVTEPDQENIEILTVQGTDPPDLSVKKAISVPKGPVGLVYDHSRGLVLTNQPAKGTTLVLLTPGDIVDRSRTWGNGCTDARGMALDEAKGYLFIACREGKLVMVDYAKEGIQVTSTNFGAGLNDIGYNPKRGHIYIPSGASAIMGVFRVAKATVTPTPTSSPRSANKNPEPIYDALSGKQEVTFFQQIGSADTARFANCVVTDGHGNVWICDPGSGSLILVVDSLKTDGK